MTHKAVLLVTKLLQNRNLLECTATASFKEDEEGYVQLIVLPNFKIRMYEKPDQKHGVVYKFEFHEGRKPYFTVQDYLRGSGENIVFLKKSHDLQTPKMESILNQIQSILNETIDSIKPVSRWQAGAV